MTSIPFEAVQNYLKQILSPRIEDQYAKETPLLANLNKNVGVEKINNKFLITVVKSMHSGVAAVEKGATLPTGYAATAQVEIDPAYVFVGFSVDDQDLEMARGNELSLANLMTINEQQMRTALAKQLNRMFFQNGDGTVALANGSGSASKSLTISNSTPNGDIVGTKYLAPGMYIAIGATGTAVKIASVDSDTAVTLSSNSTWNNAAPIYIVGPDGTTAQEPSGLVAALNTSGTFQTIARSGAPWWVPTNYVSSATYSGSRSLEFKLTNLAVKAREYGKINAIFGNISAVQRYAEDIQSIQRVVNSVDLKGGFKGLAFAGSGYDIPVVTDWDCPDGDMFGVDFSSLTLAQLAPIQWLELDGSGNILRLQGKATWEGFLKYYVQLGLRRARGNFVLKGGTFTL